MTTATVRSLTIGTGTSYLFSGPVDGLGLPGVRSEESTRGDGDGNVAGPDTYDTRTISLPVKVDAASETAAWTLAQALKVAWRHVSSVTDETLDLTIGGSSLRFYGRPRGCVLDLDLLPQGHVDALCTFAALDPYGYGAEVTSAVDSSSPLVVTNAGDVPTDRFTITVVGNGGTPVITNTTDDGLSVTFATALSGTAVLDFRARTVTVGAVDHYSDLAANPRWFRLLAGANTLTFSGCASIQVVHRPAYL